MHWWLTDISDQPVLLGSWIFWVVFSITLHELGHGFVAIRCGDHTPTHLGHMTLNPLMHIPRIAWVMFILFGFTWGLMPVNPRNFRHRYDDARVSFAGPAVNLMLFLVCVTATIGWVVRANGAPSPWRENIHLFLYTGCVMNAMGFVFNLLPVPPLDGSAILADFVPAYRDLWTRESTAFIGLVAMGLLFFSGGPYIWGVAYGISDRVIDEGVRVFASHAR